MSKTQQADARRIYDLFHSYCGAYAGEWERLEKCERMYRGDHWYGVPEADKNEPRPMTPVIQSTIESVRADLLDQLPEAVITADDPEYEEAAGILSYIVAENHQSQGFETEYARMTRDLLVGGYMVQEVGFDATLNRGLGAAFIRWVDNRSILFDPSCADIQDSRAIFKITPRHREWFAARYPKEEKRMERDAFITRPGGDGFIRANDEHDVILFIECWLRDYDEESQRYSVHMLKLAGGVILEDSRRERPDGYFSHGEYPFIVTPLFARKGTALGLGMVDMFETQQRYADKLDQIVLKNALMASRNKLLVTGASGFDADDLRDWAKEVHRGENLNGISWFATAPLPAYIISYIQDIRESIKEESGANDFSRGGTTGGVTAASAIIALQEASSKRTRMAARIVHGAFRQAVRQEIEVERDFCQFQRKVFIPRSGSASPALFSRETLYKESALGNSVPLEFKVSVKIQRESRFSVAAHNELIIQLVQLGMLTPEAGLEMMRFDGKAQAQSLMRRVKQDTLSAAGDTITLKGGGADEGVTP